MLIRMQVRFDKFYSEELKERKCNSQRRMQDLLVLTSVSGNAYVRDKESNMSTVILKHFGESIFIESFE